MSGTGTSTEGLPTFQSYRQCLKVAVSALLNELGFEAIENAAMETMCEMVQSLIVELGRSSRSFCEVACRAEPLAADVILAMVEMGMSVQGLREHAFRPSRKTVGTPTTATQPRTTSILHTGDRKRMKNIIPDHFPEMPDSHSYIRTPTHKQPVTDYESVREKASSQKRDVERALTRFIAKTGKTHSLFNNDDQNLFPLISCDRVLPDQPIMPPYINALLFKDQIFEEDEREYVQRKRKRRTEKKDIIDDDSDEEGKDEKEKKLNESMSEDPQIDNPYLRVIKMPRQTKRM